MRKGKTVKHCSKGRTGTIKTHKTVGAAKRQHRAIMANKRRSK